MWIISPFTSLKFMFPYVKICCEDTLVNIFYLLFLLWIYWTVVLSWKCKPCHLQVDFFLFSLRKLLFDFYRKNHLVKPGYYRQKTWPVVVVIIQEPLYLAILNLIGKFFIWVSKIVSDWSRKLTPSTQLIRIKTKTIRDLVTRVFPHF